MLCIFVTLGVHCGNEDDPKPSCNDSFHNWVLGSSDFQEGFKQNCIYFSSYLVGYSVGHGGSIMKTTNGGSTWTNLHDVNSPNKITELNLTNVFFVNDDKGFITGDRLETGMGEEVLKGALFMVTENGGNLWSKKYFSNIKSFEDILFFDESNGIAIAKLDQDSNLVNKVLTTNNNGDDWQELSTIDGTVLSFSIEKGENAIFILTINSDNNSILSISDNKGITWHKKDLPEQDCNEVMFANDSVGFLSCGTPLFGERIYKTDDQGEIWTLQEKSPVSTTSTIHFSSEFQYLVINNVYDFRDIGGEFINVLISFDIFETEDGGKTWIDNNADFSCGFNGPSFDFNKSTLFILGKKSIRLQLK